MKTKEQIIVLLKRIYSNLFSFEEGATLICDYILERTGQRIEGLEISPFEMELYNLCIRQIVSYYEIKFTITKIFNKENKLIQII